MAASACGRWQNVPSFEAVLFAYPGFIKPLRELLRQKRDPEISRTECRALIKKHVRIEDGTWWQGQP
jgi:hypothetical protein